MKKRTFRRKFQGALHVLISLVVISSTRAESIDRESDHEELRSLRKELVVAIEQKDMDKLAECLTATFSFTGSDQTRVTNKEEMMAYYEKLLASTGAPLKDIQTSAEAEIETIFVGPSSGYVYGRGTDTFTLNNGSVLAVDNKWTAFVVKEKGKWKVAAVHVGVNFYDNPAIDKLLAFNKILLIGSGFVALIIGVFIGRKSKN